jgi:hypothetical protein
MQLARLPGDGLVLMTMLRNPIERVLIEYGQLRSGRQTAAVPDAARCPEQRAAATCDRGVLAHQWSVSEWLQCKGNRALSRMTDTLASDLGCAPTTGRTRFEQRLLEVRENLRGLRCVRSLDGSIRSAAVTVLD